MKMAERSCRTCLYWRENTHARWRSDALCYFNPPVAILGVHGMSTFRPRTDATDLCGQWEHDGEEEPQ